MKLPWTNHQRTVCLSLVWSTMCLTGCGYYGNWRQDNPDIRLKQKESIARFPKRPISGESIDQFFSGKVGLVTLKNSPVPSGRAVPVSEDGYYLTAWHVVGDGGFFLSDIVIKPMPGAAGKYDSRRYDYAGQVIWHDAPADLAIVKFDYKPSAVFKPRDGLVEKGAAVFSGATGNNSGITFQQSENIDFNSRTGNGAFQTAGRVTHVKKLTGQHSYLTYQSSLVGRGGMSGGPVVDGNGALIGIVCRVNFHLFSSPTTEFRMISRKDLEAIIAADRKSKSGG